MQRTHEGYVIHYKNNHYPGQIGDEPLSISFRIEKDESLIVQGVVDWQDDLRISQMENIEFQEWDDISNTIKLAYKECVDRLGDNWKRGHAQ